MKRQSKGFILMAALFLIVTFAAIGLYLVTIATGAVEGATQAEQGARAYQAARTGIDWAAFQILRNSDVPPAAPADFGPTCRTSNAATQTLDLGTFAAAGGTFRVTLTCSRSTEVEGGTTVEIYVLKAIGCNAPPPATSCPGTPDSTYVDRELQLVLSK
jgi:MSHA biogenesis protein MshP